ncbi:alpha/beta hydrolase [Roseomonas elaeocarpi]|uniref:Alpha/beta hydrolase n=1 Tax=Roseomonas elaeocarpi TaxID=907779 RepID=A0ABV6JTH2_9PROT
MSPIPRLEPASGRRPRQLVVILHGVGASGADLIGFAPPLAEALPDALFLAPDAPNPFDGAPTGRQWFPLRDWRLAVLVPAVRAAAPALTAQLEQLLRENEVAPENLVLVGFSQGAMMALHVGLRLATPPAAILAYAGMLLDPASLVTELRKPPAPVLLVHGEDDGIVPADASRRAYTALFALGVPVESRFTPALGHTIDVGGIMAGADFLRRKVGAGGHPGGEVAPPAGALR